LQAWKKSKEPGRRARTSGDGTEVFDTAEREGNIAYLHAADKYMQAIRSIWGADVAPATNEESMGIAQLIESLEARGATFDVRLTTKGPADPGGVHPGPDSGTPEVQGGPGQVQ
jgi:hypothetical protein